MIGDGPRSLGVHLLAGLPTEAVQRGFDRVCEAMPVAPLTGLADFVVGDATRIGVLLPPFAEPSWVLESWEECEFLSDRFGRPAHVAGVSTVVPDRRRCGPAGHPVRESASARW